MKKHIFTAIILLLILTLASCSSEPQPTWEDHYNEGVQHYTDENYGLALTSLEAALELSPDNANVYIARAKVYIAMDTEDKLTLAVADCEKAVELDKTAIEAYTLLADIYKAQNDHEKVLDVYSKLIEALPTGTDAYLQRAKYYLELEQTEENLTLALNDYNTVLEIDNTCIEAYLAIANIYILQGKTEDALDTYTEIIALTPDNPDVYIARAELNLKLDSSDETLSAVLADYQKAIELGDTSTASHIGVAKIYEQLGKPQDAINAYTAIIELEPEQTAAYLSRANAYMSLEVPDTDKALTDYQKVIELDNTVIEAHKGIANIYVLGEKHEEAINVYTLILSLDENDIEAYIGRADSYVAIDGEDNLTAAMSDYEKALALDKMISKIYIGIANIYIIRTDYEAALEILEKGTELLGAGDFATIILMVKSYLVCPECGSLDHREHPDTIIAHLSDAELIDFIKPYLEEYLRIINRSIDYITCSEQYYILKSNSPIDSNNYKNLKIYSKCKWYQIARTISYDNDLFTYETVDGETFSVQYPLDKYTLELTTARDFNSFAEITEHFNTWFNKEISNLLTNHHTSDKFEYNGKVFMPPYFRYAYGSLNYVFNYDTLTIEYRTEDACRISVDKYDPRDVAGYGTYRPTRCIFEFGVEDGKFVITDIQPSPF